MRAIFEKHVCDVRFKSSSLSISWHRVFPHLAVSTANGAVMIYNEEGVRMPVDNLSRPSSCHSLKWHPFYPLLVTGWRNGKIIIYDDRLNKKVYELETFHEKRISIVEWNKEGTRLVTGDEEGKICIFECSRRKTDLVLLQKYNLKGYIDHCCLKKIVKKMKKKTVSGLVSRSVELNDSTEFVFEEKKDHLYLFATSTGHVFLVDEHGQQKELFNAGVKIKIFLYFEEKKRLIVFTEKSILIVYEIRDNLQITKRQLTKINVCTKNDTSNLQGIFVGKGMVATCSNEKQIRVWNFKNDDNYSLRSTKIKDTIVSMDFNPLTRVLCGITEKGHVLLWEFVGNYDDLKGEDDWELYGEYNGETTCTSVQCGTGTGLYSFATENQVFILSEIFLQRKINNPHLAIQKDSNTVLLHQISNLKSFIPIHLPIAVKKMDVLDGHMVFTDHKVVEIYEISRMVRRKEPIEVKNVNIGLHQEGIFLLTSTALEMYNFEGIKKQVLEIDVSRYGRPKLLDIKGDYIAVSTERNYLILYQVSGRVPRPNGLPFKVFGGESWKKEKDELFGGKQKDYMISSIKLNASGNRISILSKMEAHGLHLPNTFVCIYDVNRNKVAKYDFGLSYPVDHFWDEIEPKLFAVETKSFHKKDRKAILSYSSSSGGMVQSDSAGNVSLAPFSTSSSSGRNEVFTLFSTQFHGICVQDRLELGEQYSSLIGSCVPNLFYMFNEEYQTEMKRKKLISNSKENVKKTSENETIPFVETRPMKDFEGIKIENQEVRKALLSFSYNLTIGNLDEAYNAVKTIKDEQVWRNMAKMCVKTKNMDVAELCFSHMQDSMGSYEIRKIRNREANDITAQVGVVAIQLGMIEEAKELYEQAQRYDLLNQLYQSLEMWGKAVEIAKKFDRIHLQATYYQYARFLEENGNLFHAAQQYELAGCHLREVPRMFLENRKIAALQKYVSTSNDLRLFRWWANYCEGIGEFKTAITFYIKARDFLSLVRIQCVMKHYEQAEQMVNGSNDKSAAFHYAREMEALGETEKALKYYKKAGRNRNGLLLAMKVGDDQSVMRIANESTCPTDHVLEGAEYFEEKGDFEKAVLLYKKGGFYQKAIDFCFKEKLFDRLLEITSNLPKEADPQILRTCGEYYIQNKEFILAAKMLIRANAFREALDLIREERIIVSSDMIKSVQIPRVSLDDANMKQLKSERKKILLEFGKVAEEARLFKEAYEKYLMGGDKILAMKALIQSGEYNAILKFAEQSRSNPVRILAANYIQTMKWHRDYEKIKRIIGFYTKAKAWEKLINFFLVCAKVEIDEFRDYEKARDAYVGALKIMKPRGEKHKKEAEELKQTIQYIKTFLHLRNQEEFDLKATEKLLERMQMIQERKGNEIIRIGDIYALIIENFYDDGKKDKAYEYILRMRKENIEIQYYLEEKMVKDIFISNGIEIRDENEGENEKGDDNESDDDVDDVVEEDLEEDDDDLAGDLDLGDF